MMKQLIAVFISTHETMRAEMVFKEEGIKVRTAVKPMKISSNCQLALTFESGLLEKIMEITKKESLKLSGFYRQEPDGEWLEVDLPETAGG